MSRAPNDCVLCAEDGGRLIWRDDVLRVIAVDEPRLPGYTRVLWQAHIAEMTDLTNADRAHVMRVVYAVEEIQRQVLGVDKVNLASLGNMTPHLHWHVMPRWRDDPWFPDSIWAPLQPVTTERSETWTSRLPVLTALQADYEAALEQRLAQR